MSQINHEASKISLVKDMERIIKKTKISNKLINEQLDYIIAELEDAKANNDFSQIKDKLQNQKPLSQVKQANKECYAYISKMGKNIDKLYKKNLQYGQEHVQLNQQILTELIKAHLLREGEFDAYLTLVQESQSEHSNFFEFFKEILSIANDIKQQNLESAIEWAKKKDESELLFQLFKQKFVLLFQTEGKSVAINFVRNTPEMQKIIKFKMYDVYQMTMAMLDNPESQKKCKQLFDNETNWPRILKLFLETASRTQNLPTKSEIKTVFQAGCLALPKLIKYNQVTRNRSSEVISNDIPIDIEIGREYKYHSFFVCPVSREVTKPDNPPMLLKCGHVISKLSADKMTQNKTKFKCPTCPVESKLNDLKQLIFM